VESTFENPAPNITLAFSDYQLVLLPTIVDLPLGVSLPLAFRPLLPIARLLERAKTVDRFPALLDCSFNFQVGTYGPCGTRRLLLFRQDASYSIKL